MIKSIKSIGWTLAIAAPLLAPLGATAGEIVLTSRDGSVTLRGEFVGIQQEAYQIDYNGHVLHVPLALMTCEGADCLTVAVRREIILVSDRQ